MERFDKIAAVENEIEAISLREELEERRIPHIVQSYHDSAYDGLFQFFSGWGHVEAPVEHREEILAVLVALRERSAEQHDEKAETDEDG